MLCAVFDESAPVDADSTNIVLALMSCVFMLVHVTFVDVTRLADDKVSVRIVLADTRTLLKFCT